MRAGRNPTRRNRNIGTAKSGHGLANRLVIPEAMSDPRRFWEKLRDPVEIEVHGFTILVEPCDAGFAHSVTVDDLVRMLGLMPARDLAGLHTVVLRQPTKKQRILSAVWGRLLYYAEFGERRGPAIIIEAQRVGGVIGWPRSLTPDDAEEIERLRDDGHSVTCDRRWRVQTTLESCRNTQLFRTLPHELGHHVHHTREVEAPAREGVDQRDELNDRYFRKPQREREDFAHRYARETVERLAAAGSVPFPRIVDDVNMKRWKLDRAWFGLASSP